ncbi:hypothetical protein EJV46_13270 [Roseococcus sp. SYP-B2431]|uniref:hypothetical protein n=1 Tax=Roseococcus sp. SYP-B2431 TaxID=2496640 RepID=UPI001040C027|nr:hypothetical protein [Roseococcus sp. SYP-B2431]TCH98161.1 hypothetical protein EJV46_13270 [Roseococcus sp. SYP-B2431]
MPTTKTLTVAQLLILTTAAQRPDHMVLPLPPTIRARGGAQRNLLGALLKMELATETPVDDASTAWRTDEAGQHQGLRLTVAGLAAAGASADAPADATDPGVDTSKREVAASTGDDAAVVQELAPEQGTQNALPRQPTGKLGEVLQAISAEAGATLVEITARLAATHHPRRCHRPAQARLRRDPRPSERPQGLLPDGGWLRSGNAPTAQVRLRPARW